MQDNRPPTSQRGNPPAPRRPLRSGYPLISNSSFLPVPRPLRPPYPNAMQIGGSPPYIPNAVPYTGGHTNTEGDYFDRYRPSVPALTEQNYNRPSENSMILSSIEEGWTAPRDRLPSPWEHDAPIGDMAGRPHNYGSSFYDSHPSRSPSLSRSVGVLEGIDDLSSAQSRGSSVVSSNYQPSFLTGASTISYNSWPAFLHPSATYASQLSSGVNAGYTYSSGSHVPGDSHPLRPCADDEPLNAKEPTPDPSSSSVLDRPNNDPRFASASDVANSQPHPDAPFIPSIEKDSQHALQATTLTPVSQRLDDEYEKRPPPVADDLALSRTGQPDSEKQSTVQSSVDGLSLALVSSENFTNAGSQSNAEDLSSVAVEREIASGPHLETGTSKEKGKAQPSQKCVTDALAEKIKADLQSVYSLLNDIAQKYDLSMEKTCRIHRNSLQHRSGGANSWIWYESYFAEHEEQELRRCFPTEKIAEKQEQGIDQATRSACYNRFKQQYPKTYSEILFTHHLKAVVEESGEQTVHQRNRAFQQYVSQLREQAESAHFTYNFETAFVVVGSNAHQDDKNAAVHETEFLQGLFQRTTRSRDASEFMGHARAQTLMGLSQRTVEENFGDAKYPGASNASTSPSKATHSSSHESNATSSAKPVESGAELRGTACKNSEELWLTATTEEVAQLSDEEALAFIKVRFDHLLASHCITQSRSSAKQAVKNVPWQTLPGKLIDWGVRLLNWPNGVRCPGAGDSSSRKGISTLNKEERRTLAMAFIDPVRPIQMEKIQKKQEKGEYIVVIDSVAPPADSADDSGVRIQVLQRDHRVVKATRGLPRLCPTTPPPRNAGTQSSKEAGVPAKRSIQSEDEEEIEVLDTPTPRPRKMPRLDGNAAKQGSTMDLLEPDDDRDSENGPEPHNPPSRDASRSQKPVVELPLCPKGKEKPKSIEQEKSSNLRVYRPMPDLDLIAPMIRGTTHTVKPRPIVRKSQASLPSVSQQDNGSKVAATSEVADNHAGQPTFAPEQAIPITSKKDNHSTNGQTGLSTDAPSIALASTLCEGQPFEQARSGHSQTLHPLATTSGYPAATNVPIPPQFLTFMQQLLQAQQRSAPSGGPFISNPHTNVPPLFPPLGASGDVPRLPFGSTPTLRNESGPFGQPALPGPSNRSNSSDQTLPLPGGSVQSQVQPQSNTQQP